MGKVRLTKNELKKQKDNLKRYTRYLPTLELKKKQLLQEIRNVQKEIEEIQKESDRIEDEVTPWVDVFAESFDLESHTQVREMITRTGNIAGIQVPFFEELHFEEIEMSYESAPLWVDTGIVVLRDQISREANKYVSHKRQTVLREELRTTIQRIKLFEEVKIPDARENIRVIQIFLGDLQTAEVVRGKIAKAKIERKKVEAARS